MVRSKGGYMNYWLMKSEPTTFGIDHLESARKQSTRWDGVRNYQARNMLRDDMKKGDLAFFYHSSCPEPGIAGIVEIIRAGYPDASAWDPRDDHFDANSPETKPLWYTVDVKLKHKFDSLLPLTRLREHATGNLAGLWLLRTGSRLSITPVDAAHWKFIRSLL
jgi:predicted RNA-binding protein with PUA-like domain